MSRTISIAAVASAVLYSGLLFSEEPKPVVGGTAGQRAFDDLAKLYADGLAPPYSEALKQLRVGDAPAQEQAGLYLFALLKQSFADETNGRAVWRRTPFWGGGAESAARKFRSELAKEFASKATSEAALGAALWLLNEERLAESQSAGFTALRRIEGSKATAALQRLLAEQHPNGDVLSRALVEVERRGLKELGPQVLALCGYYRKDVRSAAQHAAETLKLAPIPAYDPEKAFTPRLEKQLRDIADMLLAEIPKDARWVGVTPAAEKEEKPEPIDGWLVRETDKEYHLIDWFGDEISLAKAGATLKTSSIAKSAEKFGQIRSAKEDFPHNPRGRLSRQGMLTAQFQPAVISQPECLVGAWAFLRGDRKAAAAVLFERIDEMSDDRWLTDICRDLFGHQYHQAMLIYFSHSRDYPHAMALAKHLSKPVFDGYQYQDRAKTLAAQLARRTDDFKTFTLPLPEEWKTLKGKLSRVEQIKYLADRLRLLNCQQWGQPGGVNYEDEQFREARDAGKAAKPVEVINPYNELKRLKLQVADLPILVPYLADENYMLVFSYWRDFHPSRTLHQVNSVVAELINDTAKKDLAGLAEFSRSDDAGRKVHLAKIVEWCKANGGKSREDLLLESLATTKNRRTFEEAAGELVRDKNAKALPILLNRMRDFPQAQESIVKYAYGLNLPDAAEPARQWVKNKEEGVQFWSALILLRHGDRKKLEGLDVLKAVLDKDDGSYYYPRAINDLLASKKEEAATLASAILKKQRFASDFGRGPIVQRLFVAGRQEAIDYLLTGLDSQAQGGTSSGSYKGERVSRELTEGDRIADFVAEWRTDKWAFDSLAPDAERKVRREELKPWLKEQFARIKAGQKPMMRALSDPVHGEWQLDAP